MKYLLPLLLCSTAFATPFDWRIPWWNGANSMQNQIVPHGDLTKHSILLGLPTDNFPTNANLGSGFSYNAGTNLLTVDFTGYATISSLSGYVATTDFTWSNLTGKPTDFTPSAHTHSWVDIVSGKPTTLSGYGITDGVTMAALSSTLSSYATTAALTSGLAGKLDTGSFTWSGLGGKPTTVSGFGISDAVSTSGSYANPSWITSLAWSKVAGAPAFITGISSGDVTTALGYTPYNGTTNPSGFLTGITSGQVTGALGFTPYNATNPSGYVNQAGARSAISLTTTGTGAATYNSGTGELNVPTPPAVASRVFTAMTPTLNSAAQLDASRDVLVSYSVDITVGALLVAGTSGTVVLEYADNLAMTTNVVTVGQSTVATGGVLNITNTSSATLSGIIPAGKYRRIRTVNNTGTPTFTTRASQEVKL